MKNKCWLIWSGVWIILFILDFLFDCNGMLCNKGFSIIEGEYYRVFTGLLLHINWFHLLANVIAMYFVCDFLQEQVSTVKMFLFSVFVGIVTYVIFSTIFRESYSVGGSPAIFALIGLVCVLQFLRKDLPRFRLGTWYGNWIVGYAILGNLPWFSQDASSLMIHSIAFVTGVVLGFFVVKLKVV